jgi:glycosyltransferase involved in cell wall biosynthesis
MVSFKSKLSKGLIDRGYSISTDLADTPYSAVLVIGGTRDLIGLRKARRNGIPIIQRLNGMNWIHRRRWTGLRHFLRAEYGNLILSYLRSRLADRIVYQSEFSHRWWEGAFGPTRVPWSVVYNGVDLERYTPNGSENVPQEGVRILLVEGAIAGGYEWGLETAVQMAEQYQTAHSRNIELMVVGRISDALQQRWKNKTAVTLTFTGAIAPERIPEYDRSAHLLYAADLNAACPNSVIEALACGLPVVAFDTGALSELVKGQAGRVVPYGGDSWKLQPPDIHALVEASHEVIEQQSSFRQAARSRAEEAFGIDRMLDGYLEALHL